MSLVRKQARFLIGVKLKRASFYFCLVFPSSLHLCVHAALKRVEVEECVRWMVPFATALREVGGLPMKTFTGISADDMHNIQTHASYMTWLVRESETILTAKNTLKFNGLD